jgi:hypothetical protein
MRRLFWLGVGLGAGVTGALAFTRWMREQAERMAPANIARQAAGTGRDAMQLLGEAMKEFRRGADQKEQEIRSSLDRAGR